MTGSSKVALSDSGTAVMDRMLESRWPKDGRRELEAANDDAREDGADEPAERAGVVAPDSIAQLLL